MIFLEGALSGCDWLLPLNFVAAPGGLPSSWIAQTDRLAVALRVTLMSW
jgi:hypothetical protein